MVKGTYKTAVELFELIETLWNVNLPDLIYTFDFLRINRNIVECKL